MMALRYPDSATCAIIGHADSILFLLKPDVKVFSETASAVPQQPEVGLGVYPPRGGLLGPNWGSQPGAVKTGIAICGHTQ